MFGAPRLYIGTCEARFRRRQPLAVLSVLALHARPMTRDELCYLLWPDADQEVARQRLRRSLSELRRSIGAPADRLIPNTSGSTSSLLRFDAEICRVDAHDFLELSSRARELPDPAGLRAAERAAQIGAEPLLQGLELDNAPEFEHWMHRQRERFERLRLDVLRRMVSGYTALEDYPRAIASVEQALALDALGEDLHRQAIWLYAVSGRRSDAIRQFAWCASLLERELAIEPDEATRAVYQAVLNDRLDEARALAFPSDLTRVQRMPTEIKPASPNIVARQRTATSEPRLSDLALGAPNTEGEIAEAIIAGLCDGPRLIWIEGPAGSGKNVLVQHALESASRRRPELCVWSASARGAPYDAPFRLMRLLLEVALQQQLHRTPDEASEDSTPTGLWMSEAVRLLPELRAVFSYLPPRDPHKPDDDAAPTIASRRLLQALPRALLALAGKRPTAIVLNDLDAADSASLEAIGWLARGLADAPIVLILTSREDDSPARNEALRALAQRLHTLGVRMWRLPGLSATAVRALVQRWGLPTTLADAIWAHSAGAPRAVLEMLRAALALRAADDVAAPESLRAAIHINLATLDPISRQVLEAAAVLGGDTADQLQQVSGRSPAEVERACEVLAQRDWLLPIGDRYIITYPEVQQAALDALSPARRQRLHQQAAALLGRRNADPHTIAYHLEAAGQHDQAAAMWLQAARRAREVYAYEAALSAIRHGLALCADAPLQFDLLCEQEHALHESGQREQQAAALAALQAMADAAPQHPEWQAEVHYRRGRYALARNAWSEAVDALQRAAACTLYQSEPVLIALARALAQSRRWAEAESALQRALALAQNRGDATAQAQVWLTWAEIERSRERYDAAEAALNQAVAAAGARSPLLPQIMLARGALASVRNDFGAALTYAQEAQRLFAQRGAPDAEAAAQVLIARMCARLGRPDEALAAYQAAYAGYAALDLRQGMAAARVNASTLALRMGDFTHGIALAREAYALFQSIQDARGLCVAASNLGAAYVWLGEGTAGESWLRESYERATALDLPAQQAAALANLGAALLQQGRLDEARQVMEQGLALRAAQGHLDASIDRAFLAIACLRLGDLAAAEAHSAQAVADLERIPQVENPQQIWFARAQVLRALGRPDEARAALDEAVACLRRVEAALPAAQRERYCAAFAFNRAILRACAENDWPDPPALA
ncbi:MAG: tetratricopeptide repeat protein [Anaerolineae bacterium]|nr:tetratricopeptide repeat protein [Anaerolineae bacterium]